MCTPGCNSHLSYAVATAALGSAFQHGYNTGVLNAPQEHITAWIGTVYEQRFGESAAASLKDNIFSVVVSIYLLGGLVGALMSAWLSERFGRRGTLFMINFFVFIGAILMGSSKLAKSYEMLIIGRFFIGVNSGLNAVVAPMYLAEISPPELRGSIGTVYQLVLVISILLANVLGLPQCLGTGDLWPILLAVTAIPAFLMLFMLPFCPESPKYTLIFLDKEEKAQKDLVWLRSTSEVQAEMSEMRKEHETMKNEPKVTLGEMWSNKSLRQPLIIAMVIMLSQQLSGINAAVFFSTQIFSSAGLDEKAALYSTLGMSVVNLIMTIVSLVLVERAGRRTLHLVGLSGMAMVTVTLTFCLTMKDHIKFLSYISIAAVFMFIMFFAVGPGPIPWFLVSELFSAGPRGLANSLAVSVNWAANFLVGLAFLPLKNVMGSAVFLVFTLFLVLFWIYTYRKVPETKGKTPEEVAAVFRAKNKSA